MAGEFSFSIALSLMILGLGLLANGMRTGKYRSWAAIVLSLAIVCHGIVAIYTVFAALIIVLVNIDGLRRFLYGLGVGVATLLLPMFWIGPFVGNHQYMTDMKYGARPEGAGDSFWDMFFPLTAPLDILVTALAVIGFVRRDHPPPRQRRRPGRDRPAHRRRRLRHPGEPPGHRVAVEPAAAAAAVPHALPADDGRRRRARRLARQRVASRARSTSRPAGSAARSRSAPSGSPSSPSSGSCSRCSLATGGGCSTTPASPCTRGGRCARRPRAPTPRATDGRGTTSPATRAGRRIPSTTTSCRRWTRSARRTAAAGSRGRTTRTTGSTARRWP